MRISHLIVALAAIMAGVAGCTNAESDGSPSTSIDDVLGLPTGEDRVASERAIAARAQELTKECMRAAGFDYTVTPEEVDALDASGREQIGFGILEQQMVGLDPHRTVPTDPNRDYYSSLSTDAKREWDAALNGLGDDDRGCLEASYEAAFVEAGGNLEAIAAFDAARGEVDFQSDPRYVQGHQQWQSCMAEAGYPFSDETELYQYFHLQLSEIWASSFSASVPAEEREESARQALEKMQALQDEEVAIKQTFDDCAVELEQARRAIEAELEQNFLTTYLDDSQ